MKLAKSFLSALIVVALVITMGVSAFAYNDVADDNEALQSIEYVDRLGILTSTWNGDFKPDQYLTRADAIVAIYRTINGKDIEAEDYEDLEDLASGLEFLAVGETGDVSDTTNLKYYLAWAVDNFLVSTNTENSMFKPSEPITANELITLIAKILLLCGTENSFPDDYTAVAADVVGGLEPGDEPVTREQGAVAIANAIISADGTAGEFGVYEDFDGAPLNSLAVNVFHMSSIDLVIRATAGRNLGYTVKNNLLLSNGADISLDEDLSDYVGYGINIIYRDADNSKTYTEDEEILTYSVSSTNTVSVDVSNISVTSGNTVTVSSESGTFNFGTATYLYLNDNPWPVDDEKYDLVKLVPAIGKISTIERRPNLKFKCMQAKETDTVLATVFASEAKPGKIVGINNGYYTIYDYYYAGSDAAYKTYYVSDCVFSSTVKVGDYVSFYESSGKCHMEAGNVIQAAVTSTITDSAGVTSYYITGDLEVIEHAFFQYGEVPLTIKDDGSGPQYNFILENSGKNHLVTWELIETNYKLLEVVSVTPDNNKKTNEITAKTVGTDEEVKFTVAFDNTISTTALKAGDFITYSDNGAEDKPTVYVRKNASKTVEVKDMGDYFIELNSDKVYYKNQYYKGDINGKDFTSGKCIINVDIANCVVSIDVL